ncbi:U11/U12 small nuclear ribonucleoprotein 35 kDa protein [Frankliniella fusca]|uniref:U11/U12 small nuclear ribonucleoprotein 35 kDa protein n=1 Tax=Frankliniella fusca TaxID=407009 RepID=A0AAE1HPG9_9NEOP|nr:U11/U12 small nuclear ribonucleoprotein 35 kDa protein [Frankliniella fusca]
MSSEYGPKGTLTGWSPYMKFYDPLKAGSIDGTDLIPHDNAVVRAMSAEYNPPDERTITSNPVLTLFVGRLNFKTSERQLKDEFSQYGLVKSCRLVRDIVTGMSRGYGFVEFRKESDAQRAWREAHGSIFHERQILVEWEFSRTMPGWIPRRLGGGLGGKKESGQLRFGGRDRPFKRPLILPAEPDSSSLSADHEHHSKFQDSCEDFRGKNSRDKYFRQDRPLFRKDYEMQSRSVSDDRREYKNNSDRKLAGDKSYKEFPYKKVYEDNRKYNYWSEGKPYNRTYHPEDRRNYKNDFYEDSYYEEGRQKYRHKAEGKSHQIHEDDERKNKRGGENSYSTSSSGKYERASLFKTSSRAESRIYKTKVDDRFSEHLDYKQISRGDLYEDYDDYSKYYENEEETNGRYSHKKFKDGGNCELDCHYSQKHSGNFDPSKYDREMCEEREEPIRKDLLFDQSSSKSKLSRNEEPVSSQATETNSKRKYRSSSVSSSSSCSRLSSKKKHKKKHKKRSKQTDSSDNEMSSETRHPSKHKKSKKKKKKKKNKSKKLKKARRSESETD